MDAYLYNQQQIAYYMRTRGLNPNDPNDVARFNYMAQTAQQAAQQPLYAASRSGPPVNVTNGFFVVEARGVFVKHLDFRANEADIRAYFSNAGPIVNLHLQRDHQTQKSKGSCAILFDSSESARNAITKFHGKVFMNGRLHVREDKDRIPINAPSAGPAPQQQPVIVSSTPTQTRRSGPLSDA